jgi:hypothetical protein
MEEHHDHEHEHEHAKDGLPDRLSHFFTLHSHEYQTAALDSALATERGIQAVKISLLALLATPVFKSSSLQ